MRRTATAAALLLTAAAAGPAWAQAPVGPQFRVNEQAIANNGYPAVDSDANGNFVVVWNKVAGATSYRIAARRYDMFGLPRGGEFMANAITTQLAVHGDVSVDPSGSFTVVWTDVSNGLPEGEVHGRRFDATGAALGVEFHVNTYTTGAQYGPRVATAPDGTSIVVWTSTFDPPDVRGQRFDAIGQRLGGEFLVNTYTTGHQVVPSVGTDGAGNFVVVWLDVTPGGLRNIVGQRFTAAGQRAGAEFQVNTVELRRLQDPSLAVAPGGDFFVTWDDYDHGNLWSRRFTAAGVPVGAEFVAHRFPNAPVPRRTATARLADGGLIALWQDFFANADTRVQARRFDAQGRPRGSTFLVSDLGPTHYGPSVTVDPSGRVVTVFARLRTLFEADVFAQRFGLMEATSMEVDTAGGPSSDGNRVLEPGETVDLRPAWRNNGATSHPVLFGALRSLTGPLGQTYPIIDNTSDYGPVQPGETRACIDCYQVAVSAPTRPATHWDATGREELNVGFTGNSAWLVHVGDSFLDVPRASLYYRYVETLLHRAVTAGCGATTYCPSAATTRGQMSVFVLKAKEEPTYHPGACVPEFIDVPVGNPFCSWIVELAHRGVTSGCGGGRFCPDDPVTREQMAVFVLRTLDPNLDPPACTTPVFSDVPANSPFCRWIEELFRRGVVSGCAPGRYCPTAPVTREQMAVFLTQTFGLTLYGP